MASDNITPAESVPGTIGVWCDHHSNTHTSPNTCIQLPSISLEGTMAASNSSNLSAEHSMRLMSPRPGRKLRLAAEEGERLRSTSPHSPRKPRTSKSPSRDISDSPPRRLKYTSSSLDDKLPSHVKETFASSLPSYPLHVRKKQSPSVSIPKIVSSDDSPKPNRLRVKPGDLRSRSMTRLDASSPLSSPKPPRSPRLGKTLSWSTDSEEDSPRSTAPLPSISSSPKKETPISSRNGMSATNNKLVNSDEEKNPSIQGRLSQPSPKTSPRSILKKSASLEIEDSPQSERGKTERKSRRKHSSQKPEKWMLQNNPSLSGASDNDGDENDVFPSSFSLPERAPLPDTSSIFQQALTNLKSRQSSLSSDPGDLHVRRSSLVNSLLNFTDTNSSKTPPSNGIDCLFDLMSTVSENDNTEKEPRLSKSVLLKVSKWTGKSRKISAPSKLVTVDQAPGSSPPTPTPSRRLVVSEITPPRRELLEGADTPRPKTITDSMSESSEETSSSSQNYVTEVSRPLISKRAMNYIMNFISKATVSDAAPGRSPKPMANLQQGRDSTMFPVIQNSSSARRVRDRRDSLRAIQDFISGGNTPGDTTEITSFDDLRNCRYIRDFKPTGKEARNAKRTTYHEW